MTVPVHNVLFFLADNQDLNRKQFNKLFPIMGCRVGLFSTNRKFLTTEHIDEAIADGGNLHILYSYNTMTDDITEKSKVSLMIQIFISLIISLVIGVIFIYGTYTALSGADKELKREVDTKVEKGDFERYILADSLEQRHFQKEIRRDLLQIKRKLKIIEDD